MASNWVFGKRSLKELDSVKDSLRVIIEIALGISIHDFGVTSGKRDAEEQNSLFKKGASKKDGYVNLSVHQSGGAVDLAIYVNGKITWEPKYYIYLAGLIEAVAAFQGVDIRWGGDWDSDGDFDDQSFYDYCHWELV